MTALLLSFYFFNNQWVWVCILLPGKVTHWMLWFVCLQEHRLQDICPVREYWGSKIWQGRNWYHWEEPMQWKSAHCSWWSMYAMGTYIEHLKENNNWFGWSNGIILLVLSQFGYMLFFHITQSPWCMFLVFSLILGNLKIPNDGSSFLRQDSWLLITVALEFAPEGCVKMSNR